MSKTIRLNTFQMMSPSHSWGGIWTHPRDRSMDYNQIDYWVDCARTAERGLFDGIFLADVFGVYDVYGGSPQAAIRHATQTPSADPTLIVSAMAHATQHLGFGVTSNLTYEHPYQFARRFSTLDHLTRGRVGWNIVTGYLESGARGMGIDTIREHDDRYDVAEDFLTAVYKLWEGSWEPGAVLRDKTARVFADSGKVHRVVHDGPYYKVDGLHLSEPSPQRTPLLFQAGTSSRGRRFAARHAEAIFLNGHTRPILGNAVRAIRQQASAEGRNPNDIRLFAGATVIVAPTSAEARDLHEDYRRHVDVAAQLALLSGWMGIDLSRYSPDDALAYVKSNAIQSMLENLTTAGGPPVHLKELAGLNAIGARSPFIVGSPQEVADQMVDWVETTDIDGFNLFRLVAPESLEAFVDLVVPELQSRGVYKTAYAQGTLREKLFPGHGALLKSTHPGAGHRHLREPAAML